MLSGVEKKYMSKFLSVFKFTYLNIILTKSFIFVGLIMMLGVFGLGNLERISEFFENGDEVALVVESEEIFNGIEENIDNLNSNLLLERTNESELATLFSAGEITHAYIIDQNNSEISVKLLYKKKPSSQEIDNMESLLTTMQSYGIAKSYNLSDEQVLELNKRIDIDVEPFDTQLQSEYSPQEMNLLKYVVYFSIFITFFTILSFSNQAALEIATEKTSKVIEIILTSVTANVHLWAKVVAIISAALTQLSIILISFIASHYLFNLEPLFNSLDVEWTSDVILIVIISSIFVLLGLISYIILSMIIGTMTNSLENITQDVMPLNILLFIPMYIVIMNLDSPDSQLVQVTSFIPFFSPFLMLLRLTSNYSAWELLLSIGLSILTIIILSIVAVKGYQTSLLSNEKNIIKTIKNIF